MTALLLALATWAAAAPRVERLVAPAATLAAKAHWKDARFSVDAFGRAWVLHDGRDLVCPSNRAEFRFVAPVDSFIQPSGASPLVSLRGRLAVVPVLEMVLNDAEGRPVLPVKPIRNLPRPGCRLVPGAKGAVYALCKDGAAHELYVLRKGADRRFELLLKGKSEIAAAAGDGETSFAAVGAIVYRLGGPAAPAAFRHPAADIRDLAYDPALGLFYATDAEVGRAKPEGLERLFAMVRPQIRFQGGALYVFSEADWGIARLSGL